MPLKISRTFQCKAKAEDFKKLKKCSLRIIEAKDNGHILKNSITGKTHTEVVAK